MIVRTNTLCNCVLAGLALSAALANGPRKVHYEDVAQAWGFTAVNTFGGETKKEYILESTGTGIAIFDFDGDGADDVFLVNGTRLGAQKPPRSFLYRSEGNGKFREVAARAGLHRTGWGQAACVGDYQNDGRPDLLVTYYGRSVLYKNLGGGKFEDASVASRVAAGADRWGAGCAFVDYDLDGFLDVFISNYVALDLARAPRPGQGDDCVWKGIAVFCGPRGLPPAFNQLLHNNGDGTFTDVSQPAGVLAPGPRYGLGVVAADFDNDGKSDIYVACDMTPSLLYRNMGNGKFEERGVAAGVAYNFDGRLQSGMGVAVADYDRNGFLDIVKTNFSGDLPSLYLNEDGRFFRDVAQFAGLARHQYVGWGAAFVDADEDGWPDLAIANGHVYPEMDGSPVGERYRYPALLYRNLGDGSFADWTGEAGPGFAPARPARGLATGDLDGDGHPEIVITNMNERPSVLRNSGDRGNTAIVELNATKSNRSAIGARVSIRSASGEQMQEIVGGGSYYSQSSRRLHFGLGAADRIERLRVRWPNGATQEWNNQPVNSRIQVEEGGSMPTATPIVRTAPRR